MAMHLLTDRELKSRIKAALEEAKTRNQRIGINDGGNMLLIVRPSGGASWTYRYRLGKRNSYFLGEWPQTTLQRARQKAQEAREKVEQGVDPTKERIALRRAQPRPAPAPPVERDAVEGTVLDLYNTWIRRQRFAVTYRSVINNSMEKDVFPAIGSKQITEVQRADILAILRGIEARGAHTMVRRVRMWLAQMWEHAMNEDVPRVQTSPVPFGQLKTFMRPRKRNLPAVTTKAEAIELMRAVRGYDQYGVRTMMVFSAHVFQRPAEVRLATWDQFDFELNRWTVPVEALKQRRSHLVPLSPFVVDLLKRHQGVVGRKGYVFPGRDPGEPYSDQAVSQALDRLGYAGLHCHHGFRAMARTILEEVLLVDYRYVEKQLSHELDKDYDGAYNRAEFLAERIAMMEQWSTWLETVAAGSKPMPPPKPRPAPRKPRSRQGRIQAPTGPGTAPQA
jgi:integrase